jgi:hypothetical protein
MMMRIADNCEIRPMRTLPARRPRSGQLLLSAVVTSALLASCSGRPTASTVTTTTARHAEANDLSVTLTTDQPSARLGEAIGVTLTVHNTTTRSVSVPVDLRLSLPSGDEVGIHRTTLFVASGGSTSESFALTTSRWSDAVGEFRVRAGIVDPTLAGNDASAVVEARSTERVIPRFEDVTLAAGVVTTVPVPACGQFANGAAWGDVDGDGWPDLVVTRLEAPVQLFINDTDGTFTERSAAGGVDVVGANGASFADYDNDGDVDLLLVGDGPNTLLRNDGTGYFTDVTEHAGLAGAPEYRSMSAAWADFDGDGFVDVYVANYMACNGPWSTEREIITNVEYHPDALYRNDQHGGFTEVTDLLPDADRTAAAFGVAWLDVDENGRPDLYLGNDFVGLSPDHNRLWLNGGEDGSTFVDASLDSGAGLYMNTMGIGIGDVDHDGDDDLALSNIGGNKLLRGDGDATFTEQAESGIERPLQDIDQLTVTWGTVVADFDLDGWLDVFFAAGNLPQPPDAVVGDQADMLFLNDGTGEHFLDVSAVTGIDATGESKGVAAADYDGDGDLDLYVVDQGGQPRLYRNVTERAGRHWLAIDLVGSTSNRDACGARVRVVANGLAHRRTVLCGSGGTGSANDRRVHLGLGSSATVDSIVIDWPSGVRDTLGRRDADQIVRVVESTA